MNWTKLQRKRLVALLTGLLVVVFFDQWSKWYFVQNYHLGESFSLWGEWIRFTLVHNYGVAFGFFNQSNEIQHYFLTIFNSLVILGLAAIVLWYALLPGERFGASMIVIGAVGNIIDRLHYGYVIDFIDVGISSYRWPVFNIADSFVSIGLAVWLATTVMTLFVRRSQSQ